MSIKFERIKKILKPKYYKEFNEFMNGQTMTIAGVFDDDFIRFVKEMEVID